MEDTPENFLLKHWVKLAIHRKGLVAVMISYYIIPLLQGASWCKMNENRDSCAAAGVACGCDSCISVADWGNFSHQSQGVWFKLWWDTMLILRRVLARALVTKYCRLGGWHSRNLFSHCFGGGEVGRWGVGRTGSFWDPSPLFVNGDLLSVSSRDLPSVPACVLISSSKDTTYIGLEPTLTTSF